MNKTLLILPPETEGNSGPMLSQGTRVLASDGVAIEGVSNIVLHAGVDSLWQATITTHFVQLPPTGVRAESTLVPSPLLQEGLNRIHKDYEAVSAEVFVDGSVFLHGYLELEKLEELCRRIRGLAK